MAGDHATWCFRKQGWVRTTGKLWYCPVCVLVAEEQGWVRERTPLEMVSIKVEGWCEAGAHRPWGCLACGRWNWAWRTTCRRCGGPSLRDGTGATGSRTPDDDS